MKIFMGKNFSCGVNYQYSEIMCELERIEGYEFVTQPEEADVIIFASTCSCYKDRIYMMIGYIDFILEKKKPEAKTYLTGCLARDFLDPSQFTNIRNYLNTHIDHIIPSTKINELLSDLLKEKFDDEFYEFGFVSRDALDDHMANLYISSGCLNQCAFCKTTFQKIPLVSMDISTAKALVDTMDQKGIETVYIRGMNISQFGLDTHQEYLLPSFIDYIEEKEHIKNVILVGFAFRDAIHHDFKYSLKRSSKVKTICGSLESGDNRILGLMDKGYTIEEFLDFYRFINQDSIKKLDTHIIAGYPTETMEDVKTTIRVLKEIKPFLEFVEVNRYKDSSFVKSHSLDQLSKETIQEHARVYSKFLQYEKIPSNIN